MPEKTPEEALHGHLQNLPGLNTLVGGRIRTGAAGAKDPRPFVVIQPPPAISPMQHTTGAVGMAETIIPIHCEGNTYKQARDISVLIFEEFKPGFHGDMNGLYVSHASPDIRAKSPAVVGGDDQSFHSVEVHLTLVHAI